MESHCFRATQPKENTSSPLPYQPEIYEENLTQTWAYIQNVSQKEYGNRNATTQYDYSLRSMRWFNQYLKGQETERPDSELDIESGNIQN